MPSQSVQRTAVTAVLLSLAGCSGDQTTGPGPTPPTVASVQITPGQETLTALGATHQYQAVAKDASGNTIAGKTFTWSSSDANVATIDQAGVATAVSNGSTSIRASTDGVTGTAALTVAQQPAALAIRTQPADAGAGEPFATQPVLEVHDARGSIVADDNTTVVTATVASGGGSLMGTAAATAVAGVATFTDLAIDGTTGSRTLAFSAQGLTGATSNAFPLDPGPVATLEVTPGQKTLTALGATQQYQAAATDASGNAISGATFTWSSLDASVATIDQAGLATAVGNGSTTIDATTDGVSGSASLTVTQAPTALAIHTQPAGAAAGELFTVQPVLEVHDARGNVVTNDNTTVATAAVATGGGSLTGTATTTAVAGVATFTDLAIDGTAGPRTLAFSAQGLAGTTSNAFSLDAGPIATVEITPGQETLTALGTTRQYQAAARDASGNTVAGATFTWNSSDANVATIDQGGLATAVGNGTTTIDATADAVSGTASLTVAQQPTALTVRTQPAGAAAGEPLSTQPVLEVHDARGNVVTNDNATVATATIASGGGSLLGTLSVTAIAGIATFTDLAINGTVGPRTLAFSSQGLAGTTSDAFSLIPGPVASVEITPAQETLTALGATRQYQAVARDASGNTITGATFTWSSLDANVATIDQTGLATAVGNGSTTIDVITDGVTGTATLTVAQQPAAVAIRTQPAGAAAGEPFTTQPVLEVHDGRGNVVTNDNATVVTTSIATGGGSLSGTASVTAVAGVVTFTDLAIGGMVGPRTLAFAAPGLTGTTSNPFTLDPGPAASLVLSAGDNQTGLAATALPEPLSVKVADAYANGVTGVQVSWSVASGSGSLSSAASTTNSSGIASVTYTLGRFAGVETVDAAATGLSGSPITFSATATPNGTISGTVTVVNGFVAPPATVAGDAAVPLGPTRTFVRPSGTQAPLVDLGATAEIPRSPESQTQPQYVPGELIVTFRPNALGVPGIGSLALAAPATAKKIASTIRSQLAVREASGQLRIQGVSPAVLAARVRVRESEQLDMVAAALRNDPTVAAVERNQMRYGLRRALTPSGITTNDLYYPYQAWHYAIIDLPEAWDITTGSASVLVAVIDDGVRFDHPDIAGNLTVDGFDFVSNITVPLCGGGTVGSAGDGTGYDPDPTIPVVYDWDKEAGCVAGEIPLGGHGLHVAGTIGALGDNGLGVTGVNWTVRIRPVRALSSIGGSDYDIAQAVVYAAGLPADDGAGGTVAPATAARIINMSLSGPGATTILHDAIIQATAAGVLVVAAAGNDGTSTPHYPAAFDEALSVSAVGPDSVLASYSTYGSTVDIAAPGGDILDGGCTYGVLSTWWNFAATAPTYECINGTSMAAPHVAGVAALVLAQSPSLTVAELRARLTSYAIDVGMPGRDDFYGYGLVNARNSLTQTFGPVRQVLVRLMDQTTGALLQTTLAQPNGAYAFTELPDGDYLVFAGQDADGDQIVGVPTRRWGAFGGSATPAAVTVNGAGTYDATFPIGLPIEVEPNDSPSMTNSLMVGGYVLGTTSTVSDPDAFRVVIPADGQYTFETVAVDGACGFALEEDTVLQLYDAQVNLLVENDNVDAGSLNYCSRITTALSAGTYDVVVWGQNGSKRYAVLARSGT